MADVTPLKTKTRPRLLDNPLDRPQMLADALKERHGAARVLVRIEDVTGNAINYEAK